MFGKMPKWPKIKTKYKIFLSILALYQEIVLWLYWDISQNQIRGLDKVLTRRYHESHTNVVSCFSSG